MTKHATESAAGRREGPLQAEVPRDEDHLQLPRPKVKIEHQSDSDNPVKESNPS